MRILRRGSNASDPYWVVDSVTLKNRLLLESVFSFVVQDHIVAAIPYATLLQEYLPVLRP